MKARRTEIELNYQGTVLNQSILRFLTGFTYKDSASGESDQLELSLSDKDGLWISDWFPQKGDRLQGKIKTINWIQEGEEKVLDCGTFLVDDIQFNGPPRSLTLGGLSIPVKADFSARKKTKTWEKVTINEVAKEIATSAGIGLFYDCEEIQIEETEQSNTTDMNFLYSLCKDYGIAMKVYNDKMILFDEKNYEARPSICTLSEQDFISYNGDTTIYGTYDGVEVTYQSTKQDQVTKYNFQPRGGNRILKINESASSPAEAEKIGKAKLREANKGETTLSITKKGDLRLFSGCCVNVTGMGHFDGKYYIDSLTHTVSSGFTTSCDMHRVLEGGY